MVTAPPLAPTPTPNLAAYAAVTPECRGLEERPEEWWLDLIEIPKIARFMTWTPRAPSYRRGWIYALAENARFDVVAFKRDGLARSTFPQVAAHPFPPGASVLTDVDAARPHRRPGDAEAGR